MYSGVYPLDKWGRVGPSDQLMSEGGGRSPWQLGVGVAVAHCFYCLLATATDAQLQAAHGGGRQWSPPSSTSRWQWQVAVHFPSTPASPCCFHVPPGLHISLVDNPWYRYYHYLTVGMLLNRCFLSICIF